jgi:hypothetical protein
MITEPMSLGLSIAAAPTHPQTLNNASAPTGGIDMQKFERALFIVDIGAVVASGSITAKLQQSVDNVTFTDLAGGAATAVSSSSKVITLEARAGQLSAGNRYLRCQITETAGQNVVVCGIPLGGETHQKPASAQDHTSVTQRLTL